MCVCIYMSVYTYIYIEICTRARWVMATRGDIRGQNSFEASTS